jgi:spore maturation protein CgeB
MSDTAPVPPLSAAPRRLRIVILGLSITSSWGNGHATTYRSLVRALCRRGHEVLFLERDKPWYRDHRDLCQLADGTVAFYDGVTELGERWQRNLRAADLVIVGSYVPDGIAVSEVVLRTTRAVVAFYDIDTPVTMAALAASNCPYLSTGLVPAFDLYLSFTGGPALRHLESRYGAPMARALYCAVDPDHHRPAPAEPDWALGYLGTYSADRQPTLEALLCEPARRRPADGFGVAGPLYPADLAWPANVERIDHVSPERHAWFYGRQRFTLNVTRADMIRIGYSPSVRLFEAAACGVPIISDWWPGLDTIFEPGREILVARTAEEVLRHLDTSEPAHQALATAARRRVLAAHTAAHRAALLETYVEEALANRRKLRPGRRGNRGAMGAFSSEEALVAAPPGAALTPLK